MVAALQTTLDDDVLDGYARTVYGYGTYDAPYWLVGIEEGSSGTPGEIARRLARWQDHGRTELDDVAEYHKAIGEHRWFGATVTYQQTWGPLIRLLLNAQGQPDDVMRILRYQGRELGRSSSQTCLLELLPLPVKKTDAWPYGGWSRLSQLATRRRYEAHYTPARVARIRERVREHAPKTVIFYGGGARYQESWRSIADVEFRPVDHPVGAWVGANQRTVFAMVMHPTAPMRGKDNAYYQRVGIAIRDARQP